MTIRIAVADEDSIYLERLCNVLEEYDDLKLSRYTEQDTFEKDVVSKKFDVLLFNPDIYDGQLSMDKSVLKIVLADDNEAVPELCTDMPRINKYQRISRIYNSILELYSEICTASGILFGNNDVKTIAVYSPVGGSGKTTIALVVAARLARQGRRTFYINLEDIPSEGFYLTQSDDKGISEIAASLGSRTNLTMKIQSLLKTKEDNLFYMNHFESPNDLYEITNDEISELIAAFAGSGLFDAVVIDMGVSINPKNIAIFESAEKIMLIEKSDNISRIKMETFLGQAHIINEYGSKMVRILNCNTGQEDCVQSSIPCIEKVGFIPSMEQAQLVDFFARNLAMGL